MIRAVIDTNVLVSALISPDGNEAFLMIAVREGKITPCLTEEIIDEYIEVLGRPKFTFEADEVADLIALFRTKAWFVHSAQSAFSSPDPTDTKYLQCASAASADFIVTGNKRHFPTPPYGTTYILNAREVLAYLDSGTPLRF